MTEDVERLIWKTNTVMFLFINVTEVMFVHLCVSGLRVWLDVCSFMSELTTSTNIIKDCVGD